jgi:hypothetical protein
MLSGCCGVGAVRETIRRRMVSSSCLRRPTPRHGPGAAQHTRRLAPGTPTCALRSSSSLPRLINDGARRPRRGVCRVTSCGSSCARRARCLRLSGFAAPPGLRGAHPAGSRCGSPPPMRKPPGIPRKAPWHVAHPPGIPGETPRHPGETTAAAAARHGRLEHLLREGGHRPDRPPCTFTMSRSAGPSRAASRPASWTEGPPAGRCPPSCRASS